MITAGEFLKWLEVFNVAHSGSVIPIPVPITFGGTGAITAPAARTNLGLGSLAVQDANAVAITGGTAALSSLAMTGDITLAGFKATGAGDPTNPQDYATKFYVDQTALHGTAVFAATTATLNATQAGAGVGATLTDAAGAFAAFSIDGVSPAVGDEVLNKDQTNAANQGIYTLTTNGDGISIPWVLTRSTTYDTPTEINKTGLIVIKNGSTLNGSTWYNSAKIVTVDTTNFTYNQFGNSYVESATGTANQIDVDNTDAQNPIFSLSATANLPGTFTIQGTVALNAIINDDTFATATITNIATSTSIKNYVDGKAPTALPVLMSEGGTSKSLSAVIGGIVWTNADSMEILAPAGAADYPLMSGGAATPNWATTKYPAAPGAVGQLLISNATDNIYSTFVIPATIAANSILRTTTIDNVAPLALANSAMLVTTNAGVLANTASMTNGQVTIGATTGTPAPGSIVGLGGITVIPGANSITISGTGGGFAWTTVTGTTQAMAVHSGYVSNNAAEVVMTLPATANVGEVVAVHGLGAGGWKVAQNAGQIIWWNDTSTTTGTGGSLSSTVQYNSLILRCIVANTTWSVASSPGSLTLV